MLVLVPIREIETKMKTKPTNKTRFKQQKGISSDTKRKRYVAVVTRLSLAGGLRATFVKQSPFTYSFFMSKAVERTWMSLKKQHLFFSH